MPFEHPEVYDTIRDRLLEYMKKPEKEMKIDFNLSAINAVSKRLIISTFRLLDGMRKDGVNIKINWFYQPDDDDVFELGEICKSIFDIPMDIRINI